MFRQEYIKGKPFVFIIVFIVVSMAPTSLASGFDDYLLIDVTVNGYPLILALDTGAENFFLFRKTAERLDLTVIDSPDDTEVAPGKVKPGHTEKCRLSIIDIDFEADTYFYVLDLPPDSGAPPVDGVIGWQNFKDNIIRIDGDMKRFKFIKKLPDDIVAWSKWAIYDDSSFATLLIKVPDVTGQEGIVLIDTGNPYGISLNAQRWMDWRDNNEDRPYTLSASYTPAVGLKVHEERWADKLAIGDFRISDIPLRQNDAIWQQAIPNLQATLGLFSFSRLEVIIDGPGGYFYTRQRQNPKLKYQYNRAAAVFVPKNPTSQQLVGHVVEDGPAHQAGIRNGDILLKIDDLDVTKWHTDPNVFPMFRFWSRPAGTKLELSLMRDGKPIKAVVELKDIFPLKTYDSSSSQSQDAKRLLKDAEQDDARAQYNLGVMYENGHGISQDYTEAVKWYRRAAEQEHAESQINLGFMYENGRGVNQDYTEAVKWYRKAAGQGHARAQSNLGNMYREGKGVTQNYEKAVELFSKGADQGFADAQYNLGHMLLKGEGVGQDYKKAFELFSEAAEQKNAYAQSSLGTIYLEGYGVEKDYQKALKCFFMSAESGCADSQSNLGLMYTEGKGVEKDYKRAIEWYRKAVTQGHAMAQYNLGEMYLYGWGVDQDYTEAVKWWRKAAGQGEALAQCNLGVAYEKGDGVPQDYKEAVKWYRKAVEQGHTEAQFYLGVMFEKGDGVTQDYTEAAKWYCKAAEQGHSWGQYNLGMVYENGKGVIQDYKEAVKWYRKAAEQGHSWGQYNLGGMYANGFGVDQDYIEAYKWVLLAEMNGYDVTERRSLLKEIMTADQIAEAQKLAKAYAAEMEKKQKE
jgi:TPR repeat protein